MLSIEHMPGSCIKIAVSATVSVTQKSVPTPASPGAFDPIASSADFQLVVTVLVLVKNCTPALPYLQGTNKPAHAYACAGLSFSNHVRSKHGNLRHAFYHDHVLTRLELTNFSNFGKVGPLAGTKTSASMTQDIKKRHNSSVEFSQRRMQQHFT